MIDVFFCSITGSDFLREAMADLCLRRWMQIPGIDLRQINDDILNCTALEFQRKRRIYADEVAGSEIYIVADDDCFLPPDFDLQECLKIMKAHPTFAVLSLQHSNANNSEWTPQGYETRNSVDVMEHYANGGIRFCRKWKVREWPAMGDGPGYDTLHGIAVREAGYRTGYFRQIKDFHLGENFSTVWGKNEMAVSK